ncbi:hypothetical protein E3N88_34191 [Mikania micrantha]|uniref:Uncharacterized protein n=1 Tax=Mikania micrantha TaxID=192012 RepID=A0A5N6MDQ3_9ASTR|nr:hypothetical protein E3N88_34191 [Mikania micrantha]
MNSKFLGAMHQSPMRMFFGHQQPNGLKCKMLWILIQEKILNFVPLSPGNNQAFGFQDGLKFDDIFGDKFDENIHELSLAFGNPNPLYEDTINVNEQKKVGLNGPLVASSKINDTFDVQTDLSMVNNSMVQDLKRVNETRVFQNNENSVYSGRTWGDYKSDEFRNSEDKKFMMGSGSNQMCGKQLKESSAKWFSEFSCTESDTKLSFLEIMSQKAQDGLFRHNERYNPSRSEPVEFRFLTDRSEHNPNALQSDPRVVFPYTYNTGIEQGFDSAFWMGKNPMMTNMSGRNVVTSVCTWCRNQFYLPAMAIHQQTQAGVSSLCPSCSAGISGQVNML